MRPAGKPGAQRFASQTLPACGRRAEPGAFAL